MMLRKGTKVYSHIDQATLTISAVHVRDDGSVASYTGRFSDGWSTNIPADLFEVGVAEVIKQ